MSKLIILTGPSCVGKGPLYEAFGKFYPQQAGMMRKVVLYNSRSPRPIERDGVDYHFRSRAEIERIGSQDGFHVMDVRGDLQAIELKQLQAEKGDVFFEGNPFTASDIQQYAKEQGIDTVSVMLSPLSRDEIMYLREQGGIDLEGFITDVMRRKLLRRTAGQKGLLGLNDLQNIEKRAGSAYSELKLGYKFDHVIANHDGEDSENWAAFYHPIADARKTLLAFADIVNNKKPAHSEKWEQDLLE